MEHKRQEIFAARFKKICKLEDRRQKRSIQESSQLQTWIQAASESRGKIGKHSYAGEKTCQAHPSR